MVDEKGRKLGKINIDQAKFLAFEKGLDLIEVGSSAVPPVCKLLDYGKYQYQKIKQAQKQKSKQKASETKEIKLSINIGQHDLEFKAGRAKDFFSENDKVKASIILRGREKMFSNKAYDIINKFQQLCQGVFEQTTKRTGNLIFAILKRAN